MARHSFETNDCAQQKRTITLFKQPTACEFHWQLMSKHNFMCAKIRSHRSVSQEVVRDFRQMDYMCLLMMYLFTDGENSNDKEMRRQHAIYVIEALYYIINQKMCQSCVHMKILAINLLVSEAFIRTNYCGAQQWEKCSMQHTRKTKSYAANVSVEFPFRLCWRIQFTEF